MLYKVLILRNGEIYKRVNFSDFEKFKARVFDYLKEYKNLPNYEIKPYAFRNGKWKPIRIRFVK